MSECIRHCIPVRSVSKKLEEIKEDNWQLQLNFSVGVDCFPRSLELICSWARSKTLKLGNHYHLKALHLQQKFTDMNSNVWSIKLRLLFEIKGLTDILLFELKFFKLIANSSVIPRQHGAWHLEPYHKCSRWIFDVKHQGSMSRRKIRVLLCYLLKIPLYFLFLFVCVYFSFWEWITLKYE